MVDTYTITYTNGNTTTFTITNGEDGEVTETELDVLRQNDTELKNDISKNADEITNLKNENAYLQNVVKQAFTETSASGTELTIDNTIEARMDLKLKGNTKQQQYSGKNLVPITAQSVEKNGVTFTINNNQLTINGTATDYILFFLSNKIWRYSANNPILEAGTYNFSFNNEVKIFDGGIAITIYNENSEEIYNKSKIKNNFSFSISEKGSCTIRIEIMPGQVFDNNDLQLQIEQGSTATDYEPYVGGTASPNPDYPQEIHCVKGNNVVKVTNQNLFDESVKTGNTLTSKYNIISDSNGVLEIQGISNFYSGIFKTYKLKAKTQYTISLQCDFVEENSFSIIKYKLGNESEKIYWSYSDGELDVTPTNTIKSISFTTDSTGQVSIMFCCNGATNNGYVKYSHIQLEQNDTATNFVIPHSEEYPINLENYELNSIADYKDYFKKENGKWYKVEKVKSIIADGTNYLCDYMFPNGTFFIYSNAEKNTLRDAFKSSSLSLFSNYLISKTYTAVFNNGEVGATTNVGTGEVGVNIGISTNKEDINTWLSTHNLIIKYVLQTPVLIEITDTTLINQLDEISQALSKKGTTIISQSNDDLPFNLDVIALTK